MYPKISVVFFFFLICSMYLLYENIIQTCGNVIDKSMGGNIMLFVTCFYFPSLVAPLWRICLQCRRPCFDSWVRKTPWRRKWQPTPVFLSEESHGQRSLAGYSPWGCKSWNYHHSLYNHPHNKVGYMEPCYGK